MYTFQAFTNITVRIRFLKVAAQQYADARAAMRESSAQQCVDHQHGNAQIVCAAMRGRSADLYNAYVPPLRLLLLPQLLDLRLTHGGDWSISVEGHFRKQAHNKLRPVRPG